MNCMITMQKEYIDLIFNGKKPFDFKNVSPKLKEDNNVYLSFLVQKTPTDSKNNVL